MRATVLGVEKLRAVLPDSAQCALAVAHDEREIEPADLVIEAERFEFQPRYLLQGFGSVIVEDNLK